MTRALMFPFRALGWVLSLVVTTAIRTVVQIAVVLGILCLAYVVVVNAGS